ncbi:MAG: LysM peptidoglycan-binding domain-containing protein [Phycisphaerales bacterium]|nr:LysM peptidoglycan-binding domain-containing protein [Phycisphaerales bacterium]
MGRETKIGLLVGMCFIVCFAIILAHRGSPEEQAAQGLAENAPVSETPAAPQPEAHEQQASRRVDDMRVEPRPRQYQLQPRRYADDSASRSNNYVDSGERFSRRTSPLPVPQAVNTIARLGERSTRPRSFEEGFADALANTGREAEDDAALAPDMSQPGQANRPSSADFLQAAQPILNAGKQVADVLATAGSRLSEEAERAQQDRQDAARREEARQQLARQEAARRESIREEHTIEAPQPRRSDTNVAIETPRTRQAPATRGVYLVKPGDNLTRIAKNVYHDDSKSVIDAIFEANRSHMDTPNHLVVGKELTLPALDARSAPQPAHTEPLETNDSLRQLREDLARINDNAPSATDTRVAVNEPATEAPGRKYKIQPGDTLTSIVRSQYGSDDPDLVARVFEANKERMASPDTIIVGRTLELPGIAEAPQSQSQPDQPRLQLRPQQTYAIAEPQADQPSEQAPRRTAGVDRNDPDTWRWYELQKGDLYSTVAQEQLGTSKRWRELAELNSDIFPDPSQIRYGVRIRIPVETSTSVVAMSSRGGRR